MRSTLHACVVCGKSSWYGDLESTLATWSDMLRLAMYGFDDQRQEKKVFGQTDTIAVYSAVLSIMRTMVASETTLIIDSGRV